MHAVDCVIPVYNPDYSDLQQAVRSALDQEEPCTITLVDDGSKADGRDVIRQVVAETGVSLVTLGENHGPGPARNVGAALGKAEFLWFCDADDWAEPHFLSTAVDRLRNFPKIVAFQAAVDFLGDLPPLPLTDRRFQKYWHAIPGNKVIRRWAFHLANGFGTGPAFRGPYAGEDVALNMSLRLFGKIGYDQQNDPDRRAHYNYRTKKGDHFWLYVENTTLMEDNSVKFTGKEPPREIVTAVRQQKECTTKNMTSIRRFFLGSEDAGTGEPDQASSEDFIGLTAIEEI